MPSSAVSLPALLQGLRRRWKLAALLGLPAALLAALVVARLMPPPQYVAQSIVYVSFKAPNVLFSSPDAGIDFATYQRAQAALVRSRGVLSAAAAGPGVADLGIIKARPQPVRWLQQKLEVDFSEGPEFLRIGLSGENAEDLTTVVNAVTDSYLREFAELQQGKQKTRLEQLKKYRGDLEARLRGLHKSLSADSADSTASHSSNQASWQRLTADRVAADEKELVGLRAEERRLDIELKAQEARAGASNPAELVSNDAVEEALEKDPVVGKLLLRQAELQEKLGRTLSVDGRGENHPDVLRCRDELEQTRKLLASQRAAVRPKVVERLRDKARAEIQQSVVKLRERVQNLRDLQKDIAAETDRLNREMTPGLAGSGVPVDAYSLTEDVTQTEGLLRKVTMEIEALQVELQAPLRVTLREKAEVPMAKDDKRTLPTILMAALAALSFVLFGIAWWETGARRVADSRDVTDALGLPVMGALPVIRPRADSFFPRSGTTRALSWDNRLTASVDSASTLLLYPGNAQAPQVVMITSPEEKEGKTAVAAHLAASMARAGRKVLLVDGDMHRPSLHQVFGRPQSPGLREVLLGQVDCEEAIQPTGLAGLSLLTNQPWHHSSFVALAGDAASALLQRVRSRYDTILIDSAPVLAVPDPLLIARHVDAVLFSVLRDVSRLPAIEAAHAKLDQIGVRVLGVVVNGVPEERYGSTYFAKLPEV
jgi:capsular exopolysaccharide synthesis family protein